MVDFFVVGGGGLSEGAVSSFAVVEDFDVVEDLGAQFGLCRPGAAASTGKSGCPVSVSGARLLGVATTS